MDAPPEYQETSTLATVPAQRRALPETDHLKRVPDAKSLRERIRGRAVELAAVPYDRRLLLLPRCLRDDEACPAECNELGLMCRDCGACCLSGLRAEARRKGYKVMIAEGSPAVMKIILGGHADALLGVACLDVLEQTLDKILLAGIPSMAVPLLRSGCRNTAADEDWIRRMIDTPHRPAAVQTRTYLHLMRCAAKMFEPEELERLAPRVRSGPSPAETDGQEIEALEPIACTEAIAYDFLAAGGKHSRPFITLASYDALCGAGGTSADGARHVAALPDAVRRIALAIEIFHKASLVHNDIEDDDCFRYGRATLHRKYGTATAINVGDYLIGLGYRLVAAQRDTLPADVVADVLAQFAVAHTKLCEGQGAELAWRDARDKRLKPLDALKIYALKTSPAFEASLLAGIRLAGPTEPYRDAAARFARHLGVAYQIVNDLDDWEDTRPNGQKGGTDLLGGRPTVLWALALESLCEKDRHELESLLDEPTRDGAAKFLAGMQTAEGGLRANRRILPADLLSTFTGLVALTDMDTLSAIDTAAARRFVRSLEQPAGGFRAGTFDDAADVEYTFYGLGALALLA